jgi:hypothetical protein
MKSRILTNIIAARKKNIDMEKILNKKKKTKTTNIKSIIQNSKFKKAPNSVYIVVIALQHPTKITSSSSPNHKTHRKKRE